MKADHVTVLLLSFREVLTQHEQRVVDGIRQTVLAGARGSADVDCFYLYMTVAFSHRHTETDAYTRASWCDLAM